MFRIILLVIIISFPFFSASCNGTPSDHSIIQKDTLPVSRRMATDEALPGNFSSQSSLQFDSNALVLFLKKYDSLQVFRKDLKAFYQHRHYAYAWFDDKGLIEQTSVLFNRVTHIEEEGLPKQLPYLNIYKQMMVGEDSLNADIKADPETELMITAQYLAFARKAWTGLPETESIKMQWYLPRKKVDYNQLLDSLVGSIQSGHTMEEPVYGQ
jgi:L,D-transpeptidase YcbB